MLMRQVEVRNPVGTSAYRRRSAAVTAQVMLWRICFVATVLAMPVAVIAFDDRSDSSADATHTHRVVTELAYRAFPQWAVANHQRECPRSLRELNEFANEHLIDPWGTPLAMKCGAPIRGVFVYSAGPDRTFDTADDITSNTVR